MMVNIMIDCIIAAVAFGFGWWAGGDANSSARVARMGCHIQILSGAIRWHDGERYTLSASFIYDGHIMTIFGLYPDEPEDGSAPRNFTRKIGLAAIRDLKAQGYRRIRWERRSKDGKQHLRWVNV